MKRTAKLLALLLVLCMAFAMFAACGNTDTPPATDPTNPAQPSTPDPGTTPTEPTADPDAWKYGGTFVDKIGKEPQFYYFAGSYSSETNKIESIVNDKLIRRNSKGEYEGRLVKNWEVSTDGLTYTFYLRDDVYWHDGEQFTANDVVFSTTYLSDPALTVSVRTDFATNLVAKDDFTLVGTLEAVDNTYLNKVSGVDIIPEHIWKDIPVTEIEKQSIETCMVGLGPFKYVDYKVGEYIQFTRNDDFYNGAPYIENYYLRVLEATAATNAFEAGELSILVNSDPAFIASMEAAGNQVFSSPNGWTYQQFINRKNYPEFEDLEWRKAFSMLFDRETLCENFYDNAIPNSGPFAITSEYYDDSLELTPYDPEAACAIIESYGYVKNADGIYEKDGKTLHYVAQTNPGGRSENAYLYLKDTWRKYGIDLEVQILDDGTLFDESEGGFWLTNDEWLLRDATNGFGPSALGYRTAFSTLSPSIWFAHGLCGYGNDTVDELFETMMTTPDPKVYKECAIKVQKALADDVAYFFIGSGVRTILTAGDLCLDEAIVDITNVNYCLYIEKLYFTNN